jgi:hypothetical protein
MIIRFRKADLLYFFISFVLFVFALADYFFGTLKIMSLAVVLINIVFIIKFHRQIPIFILFVFILLYSLIFPSFFIEGYDISYWPDFQTSKIIGIVLLSHFLFLFFLGNSISSRFYNIELNFKKVIKPNIYVFIFLSFLGTILILFGLSGENIFVSGTYANSEVVQKSTLHEYFILVFLFIIAYAPNGVLYQRIIQLFLFIFSLKTLLYGGRVEVLQILLLFFYISYVFKNRIKLKYVIAILIFGIYFSGLVSNIRANPLILLSDNFIDLFNPTNIFFNKPENRILSSTEGDVIQSSARIVGLVQTNEISLVQRVISLFNYLLSPIIPSSFLAEPTNLATFKQEYFHSGGGGLISTFFYVWLGYLGPIFIALMIGFLIKKFYLFNNKLYFIYGICLLSMFPRWFSYNPIFLIKFCIYSIFIFIFISVIQILFRKFFSYDVSEKF